MKRALPPNWPRRHVRIPAACEECGNETAYVDSVPDATVEGTHPSECGYRLAPLCWLCGAARRAVATSRLEDVIVVEEPGGGRVGFIDRGRASQDCVCEECGRKYLEHPPMPEHGYLTQLCDGSGVKL